MVSFFETFFHSASFGTLTTFFMNCMGTALGAGT
jgi:hypothetical protein